MRPARRVGEVGDTAIIGISPDKPAKQAKFDAKYGLGFPLLADTDHTVAEAFGVWKQKRCTAGRTWASIRSAFLVDAEGRIERGLVQDQARDTPTKLLAAIS